MHRCLQILMCVFSISAYCGDSRLIGTWQSQTAADLVTTITFLADQTFEGQVERNGISEWKFKGRWQVTDDTIEYEYLESSLDRIPVGTKDSDVLLGLGENKLILKTRASKKVEYIRVQ